jgi:hypothetical protein
MWDFNIYETAYRVHRQFHLRPYVGQALLWIDMVENWKLLENFYRESPMSNLKKIYTSA